MICKRGREEHWSPFPPASRWVAADAREQPAGLSDRKAPAAGRNAVGKPQAGGDEERRIPLQAGVRDRPGHPDRGGQQPRERPGRRPRDRPERERPLRGRRGYCRRCSSRNGVRTPTACASASPSSVWISWQGRFRPTRTNGTSCAETKSEIPVLVFESGETIAVGDDILAALERRYSSDPPGAREHRTRAAQNT